MASGPFLGIYSSRRLSLLGLSTPAVAQHITDGRLVRIRPGWFHDSSAHADAIEAARLGGVLTATSGSRHHGVWTLADDKLHVLVARNASRVRPERIRSREICLHWAGGPIEREPPVATPLQIVLDSARCQPRHVAVALADSALNRGLLRLEELEVAAPRLAGWCDGTAESGTESIVRVGLRRLGIAVRTQVQIDDVGRVDLVVGDRLVIECDSAAFHDGYTSKRDYERDRELVRQGYLSLRFKYHEVVDEWPRLEALILEIVRADRHRCRRAS
ncbi:hypothetical protein Back2_10280 [Nocardioides baekrokdamisoli]|uniref:DUF559 domain-containing protein n=1 Tax=Nocardioides baekrokdamisoli TaxID=1804624 RepID=A0A3G9ISZ7_9ACTN|nr:DUF559 domain-containing protein [Nocardioides baekrokdamisoli]BBH16741.1 hypothetical protein Back2_10280 [Nocardioides baekrokdamisoli]